MIDLHPPLPCYTGAQHEQPGLEDPHGPRRGGFSGTAIRADHVTFLMDGALDAPQAIPSGSTRCLHIGELRLLHTHVRRAGWLY